MDLGAALIALAIALVVKVAVMVLCGWLLIHVYQAAWSSPPNRLAGNTPRYATRPLL